MLEIDYEKKNIFEEEVFCIKKQQQQKLFTKLKLVTKLYMKNPGRKQQSFLFFEVVMLVSKIVF